MPLSFLNCMFALFWLTVISVTLITVILNDYFHQSGDHLSTNVKE